MARLAKVPVLDPSSPQEAREMVELAMNLSEEFKVPVILRPAIRVCHARQNISFGSIKGKGQKASFKKDPGRWAATPRFRLILHEELNNKLKEIQDMLQQKHPEWPQEKARRIAKKALGIL